MRPSVRAAGAPPGPAQSPTANRPETVVSRVFAADAPQVSERGVVSHPRAEETQDLVLRLEAGVHAHGVHRDPVLPPRPVAEGRREPAARDVYPMKHGQVAERNAPPAKAVPHRDALPGEGRPRRGHPQRRERPHEWSRGRLGDEGHLRPASRELEGDLKVEGAGTGHRDPPARQRPVAPPQRLRRAGRHHSREHPAGNDGGAFVGTGCDDCGSRARDEGRAVDLGEKEKALECPPDLGPGEYLRAAAADLGEKRCALGLLPVEWCAVGRLLVVLSAEARHLVENGYPRPRRARRNGGRKASGAATDDEDIGFDDPRRRRFGPSRRGRA